MKKIKSFLCLMLVISFSFAQSPQGINYQAVARNTLGAILSNQTIGVRISITASSNGTLPVYKETHTVTTNQFGLFTLIIGNGTPTLGTFSAIQWSTLTPYLKVEMDATGGTNYVLMGISQLVSVPYALHANSTNEWQTNGNDISNKNIGNVGIGITTPNSSAQLEVNSTTKGFLPPRMDSTSRNAIVSPATGLTIYNTSINSFECYNGTAWYSTVHYIGENYGGGVVFFVYDNGQHGLISSTADQSLGMRWSAGTFTNTMAFANGIGSGYANQNIIISNQGYGDGATYAARICNEYSVTVGGVTYGGWYLPSIYELNLLYLQESVVGGFATAPSSNYWSSTEQTTNYAYGIDFWDGSQYTIFKSGTYLYVRAIRSF